MPEVTKTSQIENYWYKDAVIYALQVRSFFDSNEDGIGDFQGLVQKLDYLADLGVNTLWILPFYESPMKDDGYDVTDYMSVHPDCGTMEDFKYFLAEAKKREIRVITELILNHTSDEHEWFKRAKAAPKGSNDRDYYVWSDTRDKYKEARVVYHSHENSNWAWSEEAQAYYWHRFYSHQPDLNFDNIEVQKEFYKILDFWLGLGVDGMILTSSTFLFEKEGTNCENLPETHDFIKKLRSYVDKNHEGKILMAESNMWPEDAAAYFGEGDECQMNFHFPLMPRLFMAVQTEDRFPIVDILKQTPKIPKNAQWALFLRNHNEMTLEMVTDEERDYLSNTYSQDPAAKINSGIRRRLTRLLGNDRRKIELMNVLMFSLPGSPVIYYGDEIGMGDNIYLGDRNGVRTPMQWNMNVNAGFSMANPQKLYLPVITDPQYRYEAINVSNQRRDESSLLWWTRNSIAVRKKWKAFSRGAIKFVECLNPKIFAFIREYEEESILVVANMSGYPQAGKLKLTNYVGQKPVEIFSQNKFLRIKEENYPINLTPYGYYWLSIEKSEDKKDIQQDYKIPQIIFDTNWKNIFNNYNTKTQLEKKVLENYMRNCRWFDGKSKQIIAISIVRAIPFEFGEDDLAFILNIEVRYTTGLPETYSMPVAFIKGDAVTHYQVNHSKAIICEVLFGEGQSVIIDALYSESFRNQLFQHVRQKDVVQLGMGKNLTFTSGKILEDFDGQITSKILNVEQSNTSAIFKRVLEEGEEEGENEVEFFFKWYRKVEVGLNPELELVRFLSEQTDFSNSPQFVGGIEYKESSKASISLALLQNKVPNQGDAWVLTLDSLDQYYRRVLAKSENKHAPQKLKSTILKIEDVPATHRKLINVLTFSRIETLGKRTAEMHLGLASTNQIEELKPVAFDQYYQRSLYAGHRKLVDDKFTLLEKLQAKLPKRVQGMAEEVLGLKPQILECFSEIYSHKIKAYKTRVHGDYHLGQVLFNGKDFIIIDFEGEPNATMSERRLKRTPFKDVAGMLRSYHYAAYGKILLNDNFKKYDRDFVESWAELWYHYASTFFLKSYFDTVGDAIFVPPTEESRNLLLRTYLLEKAVYEMGYEMNSRPDWLVIPLTGILDIMKDFGGA